MRTDQFDISEDNGIGGKKSMQNPVMIIGMHRSGTSMITRLLEDLGLYVGWKKEDNHESSMFHRVNDWILDQCSATWDNPAPARFLQEDGVFMLVKDYVYQLLSSPKVIEFLGVRDFLRYRSLMNLPNPWGWKDPRSTYTLPVWKAIFPEARIVHVMRHGVDVAQSLRVRHTRVLQKEIAQYPDRKALYRILHKRGRFCDSVRCLTLEGGFSLWEEYVNEARKHIVAAGANGYEIRYEDFISEPETALRRLADFCGISSDRDGIEQVLGKIRRDRTFAYREDPELSQYAITVAERLFVYGY